MRALLEQPDIDVNRRNNDRLTSFMLAMHTQGGGGPLLLMMGASSRTSSSAAGRHGAAAKVWPGWQDDDGDTNAQEKMRRLMDLPATDDLEWTRHDR